MQEITKHNRDKLIDLLTERLTFERAAVRLYDSIGEKMRAGGDGVTQRMMRNIEEFRDQEEAHGEWLEEQIRDLGGDTEAKTERSKLIETESQGIEEIIVDGDNEISHLFHALLTAELVDNTGWELLVQLADEAGDDDARRVFRRFLHEEEDHLAFVRTAVRELTKEELLGKPARPASEEVPPPSAS